ncbi:TauD/TfdA family dioxygenase [Xylella fastidiosa]|nr:TauD/TfdA family dioxygenase [Xylella fastidiosa]
MLSLNPFTYQEEKRSALLHDITPIIASSNFHTDGAYLERHLRPHTLLGKVDGMYEVKAALHHSRGLTSIASDALHSLRRALQSVSIIKRWHPADLLIFSNLRCMHGRGEIQGQRWLQRCYGSYVFPSGTVFQLSQPLLFQGDE